ncbi:MAG: LptF/LptG family permease [Muribaculaceae bacterium]|nr:LptF/LptG family permease [Muribaculaceae bacterium]
MFKIKRLYTFMLSRFLPRFLMTFCICLFIVMMQFLWRYIDELVGKGLSMDLIAELFFHAALSLLPLALPLSILLAALMTFGDLGEHVELTALKSSGISLTTIMKPIAMLMVVVAIGAFFFMNNALPKSQVKMWTLLFSMRQTSPTLDIPEGAVYSQIPGYNIYVKRKDKERDMLYNLLIYDVSASTMYPRIVAADSGRLSMTEDKRHLVLTLYKGAWYEQMSVASGVNGMSGDMYRRESFHDKEIMIPYDANFTRMDDETMKSQYVGKDIKELQHSIDSINLRVDSAASLIVERMRRQPLCGVPQSRMVVKDGNPTLEPIPQVKLDKAVDINDILKSLPQHEQQQIVNQALSNASADMQDMQFQGYQVNDDNYIMRRHQIELIKKFTLSLACLIFFFIGAPLGAIIRKGGLGMPIVISVILFIIYYIIDNTGYKLARDGRWPVWQGIWLSSAVLLPLGIFLTKKAVNDSAVFNPDAWLNFLRRITGLHQTRKLAAKEVIINEVVADEALSQINALKESCQHFIDRYPGRQRYIDYWQQGYDKKEIKALAEEVDRVVDYLSNSRDQMILNKAMDYPVIRQLLTYQPVTNKNLGTVLAALFPIGLPVWLVGLRHQKNLKRDVRLTIKTCEQLVAIFNGEYSREMEYSDKLMNEN